MCSGRKVAFLGESRYLKMTKNHKRDVLRDSKRAPNDSNSGSYLLMYKNSHMEMAILRQVQGADANNKTIVR